SFRRAVAMKVRTQIFSVFVTFLLFSTAAFYLASASPAWAQSTNTGTVAGVVTDASGAVVRGATVTLTDPSNNSVLTTTTNDAGRYIFVNVNPSSYSISVTKAGFSTTKADQQEVKVGT